VGRRSRPAASLGIVDSVETIDDGERLLLVLRRVAEHLGASVVPERSRRPGDLGVDWAGQTIGYIRGSELHGALDRLVHIVELDIGASLADMDRSQKQIAIRRLDEQGAFLLRGAVEDVATMMGVSRVTLYSYLNAVNKGDGA